MANYCYNKITAGATNSEWQEISKAFSNDQIDWPASMDGTDCSDWSKEISLTTKWSPTPWNEGKMEALNFLGFCFTPCNKGFPHLLRYRKTRYRGLQKQTAKLNMMFALANLILADRPCLAV